jgi:hypothetical protein
MGYVQCIEHDEVFLCVFLIFISMCTFIPDIWPTFFLIFCYTKFIAFNSVSLKWISVLFEVFQLFTNKQTI